MIPSPFRFTPEVLERIRYHARRGLDTIEIGYLLGCTGTTIINICKEHGIEVHERRARRLPDAEARPAVAGGPSLAFREIGLQKNADTALAREASIRGVTASSLAAKIVETIALDGLWKAVLDE